MAVVCVDCRHVIVWTLVKTEIRVQCVTRTSEQRSVRCVCCCAFYCVHLLPAICQERFTELVLCLIKKDPRHFWL